MKVERSSFGVVGLWLHCRTSSIHSHVVWRAYNMSELHHDIPESTNMRFLALVVEHNEQKTALGRTTRFGHEKHFALIAFANCK